MQLIDIFKNRTRHPFRPRSSDIVQRVFADFRNYQAEGDNLILGEGHLAERKVYVVAQQKPKPERFRSAKDVARLNWGMLTADEHSQVLSLLRQISENGPHEDAVLLSLVDTYGADISMESARRLQAFFIAHLLRAYINVPIRTISIVLGEGGSGGAIALQVADRRAAVEDAMYATAPPESVAAIIFRDPARIADALAVSKSTSKHLKHFNVVDALIPQTKSVMDADGLAENIKLYLERTIKDLMRRRLDKLMDKRLETADELGVIDRGKFFEIKRFIERPLKHLYKAPSQLKIVSDPSGATIHLDDSYGDGTVLEPGQPLVRCGHEVEGATGAGCGALIPLEEYLKNFQVCPQCGKRHVLDAAGWISVLADQGSFHELFRNMTVFDLLPEEDLHGYYRDFLEKQKKRSSFNESLVTAHATIHGYPAVLALSDFAFAGGSMGVVFGEKFRLAVEYSLRKGWPLVSVCCSGGARLYEGVVALMQMYKTTAAVERLKRAGVPYISILADPATGGAIASYAALGDVCLAEPGALVIFTGPRVMKARGFEVQEDAVRSDSLVNSSSDTYRDEAYYGDIRGIQEVVPRAQMRRAVARYLEFYARVRTGVGQKKGVRPYRRRQRNGVENSD
ncbi:MAG: acetyl-CoA carboxylase carboxyl transferase subunit alpha/beta [Proteobacteria bacterium]|nr:acetyl-CoA carboxylase carboxyl transferase subunit alpha/beta [Pseudomonadota bacterium]MBU1450210.1 acetyl-CoA carboxylase carboxyl transferase subunit alpha/beta [Pseudomonadota bacterium]MBU2468608.1 acetyl-CoA carboxylase carboxyl transferase subunit alpha/beta [Pseudomonadota bacterium]MBU2517307.1 acetyl-CoA carboxylase carboxyl transferase subunit alpha/beta [Pseudomonadota bacterium]